MKRWLCNKMAIKYTRFFLVGLFISLSGFAQKDYKGIILDTNTKEPIPYVNIAIVEDRLGTVSNEEGIFHLEMNPMDFKGKKIQFSCLGYETKEIYVESAEMMFNGYPRILMKPYVHALEGIILTDANGRFFNDEIGYRNYGNNIFGYWKEGTSLGAELATRIKAKKGLRKLKTFEFEVWHTNLDSLLVRVNFYDVNRKKGGKPGVNLNKSRKNILFTITKNTKIAKIHLESFNIYTENDFIASLELLEVFGEGDIELMLAGTLNTPGSFRRYTSMGQWERLSHSMAYHISSDLFVEDGKYQRVENKAKRSESKKSYITGFVLEMGRPVANVKVSNTNTKAVVVTDAKGRYKIEANRNDTLHFFKDGFKQAYKQVGTKPTLNANLYREAK